ncbi:MAG: ABC transporter ATP-binding protein [Eubacterium sp.]|nr:ABC transporter ATP-binding protein [Eubacterium sp.]
MGIIKVQNLTKKYGAFYAVDHISFEVERGTMLGFLGVNGAGKSTTINLLSTLLLPDEGTGELCGYTIGKQDQQIRQRIGIVYQQNCLDELLSVKENLLCAGVLHGAKKRDAELQIKRVCKILNMEDILKKRYQTLSGGQKRRCEIAAALMHTPQILFLDEPTTGLDPATRQDVWAAIADLQKKENITIFLTTHYMEEAAGADKIVILDHGKIVTEGTAFELKEKYAEDKLRLYFKSADGDMRQKLMARLGKKKKAVLLQNGGIEIGIRSTKEAIPILNALLDQMDGFEVIQGNLDDVFLNAVSAAEKTGRRTGQLLKQ